ncbi:MAG TPA: glycosyltransferase 87 family protein [Gaiellaceae bacterium]|nr:glycosyltransferase 87 family protein [Gaiellaceae bacterium]
MDARPASWSPPADGTRAAVAAVAATLAFATAWVAVHYGFYGRNDIVDTPLYQRYGDAIVDGHVPYRDFTVEYPPAALPAFVLPSLLVPHASRHAYDLVFGLLMAACGAAAVALVAVVLACEGAGTIRLVAGCGLAALAPLALGSVLLTRFDLWPVALTVAALAALVAGRDRLALGALGLAVAAKIYPLVLIPVFAAHVWKRRGRRRALAAVAVAVAVAAACALPFLALAPHGTWESSLRQTARPLQIETLGAGILLALHQALGLHVVERTSYGSQNLAGSLPDALTAAQAVLQALALLAVWVWFARGPASRERLFRACAAAVCAFMVFNKVLSPQFLVWLVPLVALVRGRRGLAAGALLAAALVLTQLWFPHRYWALALRFDPLGSWLVLARNLVLLGLLGALALPQRTGLAARAARLPPAAP